jgi:hypothetical protein
MTVFKPLETGLDQIDHVFEAMQRQVDGRGRGLHGRCRRNSSGRGQQSNIPRDANASGSRDHDLFEMIWRPAPPITLNLLRRLKY